MCPALQMIFLITVCLSLLLTLLEPHLTTKFAHLVGNLTNLFFQKHLLGMGKRYCNSCSEELSRLDETNNSNFHCQLVLLFWFLLYPSNWLDLGVSTLLGGGGGGWVGEVVKQVPIQCFLLKYYQLYFHIKLA